LTTCFSQGSAATDLRGSGRFNSNFSRRSFLNLTVKKNYEIWYTFSKVIVKIEVARFLRHGVQEAQLMLKPARRV